MNFNKTIFAGALALSLITSGVFAQVKKKPTTAAPATAAKGKATAATPGKPDVLPTDPSVTVGNLPNGLTYYIRSNSTPKKRAYSFLVTKAGSILEPDGQQGL